MSGIVDLLDYLTPNKNNKNEEEPFYFLGEEDGQGNIIFIKRFKNNKAKPSQIYKIPASQFWGTAESVKRGTYSPKKPNNSIIKRFPVIKQDISKDLANKVNTKTTKTKIIKK